MNVYDSDKISDLLVHHYNMTRTEDPDNADILILNTCSIREKAQEKYFEMIGKAKEGGVVEIDSPNTNFDFVAVDEAHNFKKLFTSV